MTGVDTRILDVMKERAGAEYNAAEKNALEMLNKAYKNAPTNNVENMIYWTLLNYYTYEVVMTICGEIEKGMEEEK